MWVIKLLSFFLLSFFKIVFEFVHVFNWFCKYIEKEEEQTENDEEAVTNYNSQLATGHLLLITE